ncbi:MAG TPA: ABC transporter substrate-binding protein/permease [Polyangiaceae bacterium]|nr:ABC transporter substrate-binding protein/permease [Polyangiaceae bacterium]
MRVWAVFCFALAAFAPALARADWASVQASGELGWGADLQGGEPYVYESPTQPGAIIGFEVDIAEALARQLGVRAKFHQNDWSNLVPSLERGDFDIALNGLEDTPARRARLRLSRPYFVYGETLAVRAGASLRTLADLRGRRIATLNQTVAQDLLQAQHAEVVLYEGQQEPYMDLSRGRVEGVLLDHVIADRYGCSQPGLSCVKQDLARGTYVIGMRPTDVELSRRVDGALSYLIENGELRRILEHWRLWDARQEELRTRGLPAVPSASAPSPVLATPSASAVSSAEAATAPAIQPTEPSRSALSAAQLGLFFQGALITVLISVCAFGFALPLGVLLAVTRSHGGRAARFLATAYVELFRGTPVLLQLYVLYYGLSSLVRLGPIQAAILGLGLNYAAYEAEVHRGALAALPRGQAEAASSLGLSRYQVLRHVLLPQSLRIALPALTNDFVALLKDSSLVSVITVVELTKRMTIVAVELRDWVVPGLLCAAMYFALSFPLSRLSLWLERRYQNA